MEESRECQKLGNEWLVGNKSWCQQKKDEPDLAIIFVFVLGALVGGWFGGALLHG